MSDLGTMKTRIESELSRTDLTSEIQDEIISAIEHYKHHRFHFNEQEKTAPTVASEQYIALPDDFIELDKLRITVNSRTYPLEPVTFGAVTDIDESTYTGIPVRYAIYNQQIRLYPTPNAVFTLTLSGLQGLDALSADSDTNAWMTDGEELIRSRARAATQINYLYDDAIKTESIMFAQEGFYSAREKAAYAALKSRSDSYVSTGRIRAHYL